MGITREWSVGAVRMSLGRTTTLAETDRAVDALVDAVGTLRERRARRRAGASIGAVPS